MFYLHKCKVKLNHYLPGCRPSQRHVIRYPQTFFEVLRSFCLLCFNHQCSDVTLWRFLLFCEISCWVWYVRWDGVSRVLCSPEGGRLRVLARTLAGASFRVLSSRWWYLSSLSSIQLSPPSSLPPLVWDEVSSVLRLPRIWNLLFYFSLFSFLAVCLTFRECSLYWDSE